MPSTRATRLIQCGFALTVMGACHHRAPASNDIAAYRVGVQTEGYGAAGAKADDERAAPEVKSARIEDLFTGRFGGLQVRRTANGGITMRLRGAEPLLVIDGLEAEPIALLVVRPQDVRRIEVLKDPGATAVYGTRGLNGVVVVTTRDEIGPE
jgi:TonB-dependent SusC/RagA subfamily outer membrane receptor